MRTQFYRFYFIFALFLFYIYLPYLVSEIVYYFPVKHLLLEYHLRDGAFVIFYWIRMLFADYILFVLFLQCVLEDARERKPVFSLNYWSLLIMFLTNIFPFIDKTMTILRGLHHAPITSIFLSPLQLSYYVINAAVAVACMVAIRKMAVASRQA